MEALRAVQYQTHRLLAYRFNNSVAKGQPRGQALPRKGTGIVVIDRYLLAVGGRGMTYVNAMKANEVYTS